MKYKTLSSAEKWIIKGIPFLFIIGSMMHFLYELSGENVFVGLIAPVNESVWEHLKMVLFPIIGWWGIYFTLAYKKLFIDKNKWFTGGLAALLTSLITIPLLYYFYTEAFGIESVIVDIFILLIAILWGQLLGLHVYRHTKGIDTSVTLCAFIVIIIIFIAFTFNPPTLPLFKDSLTGLYGVPA